MKRVTFALLTLVLSTWGLSLFAQNYIVLFKQNELSVSSLEHDAFQALLTTTNQKSMDQLAQFLAAHGVRANSAKNFWLVRGALVDLTTDVAANLGRQAWVQAVTPDQMHQFISPTGQVTVVNSPKELKDGTTLWGLKRLGMDQVHSEFPQLDGTGVRVGVIDTGIQSNHPELGNPVVFKDFMNGIASPYDDAGHGTHVSGTIMGKTVGIAPKVSMIFAKAFTADGRAYDSTLIEAMQWMFDPDGDPSTNDYPQVVSNSWGGDILDQSWDVADFLPYEQALLAWIHGGIVPVFAAGNSGAKPNGVPGGLPEAIAVGALDQGDVMADFSSRGPNLWKIGDALYTLLKPDVSAPGVGILSSYPGNKYAVMDGTSMATPHVTGAIALMLQANKKLRVSDIKDLLLHSSMYKGDANFGYGIVSAYQLIKAATSKH